MSAVENTASARDIEMEATASRRRLSSALDELTVQLTPGRMLDEAMSYAKLGGGNFLLGLGNSAKQNPLPTLLIGLGAAMFLSGKGKVGDIASMFPQRKPSGTNGYAARPGSDHAWSEPWPNQTDRDRAGGNGARRTLTGHGASAPAGDGPGLGATLAKGAATVRDSIGSGASRAADSIGAAAGGVADTVASGASSIQRGVGAAAEGVQKGVGAAAEGIQKGVGAAADSIQKSVGAATSGIGAAAAAAGGAVGAATRNTADFAMSAADQVGSAAGSMIGQVVSLEEQGMAQVNILLRDLNDRANRLMREQPLVMGALGLAAGAIIAALLPSTRAENDLMGSASDQLKDSAGELAAGGFEKAGAVASKVMDTARDIATKEGLTPAAIGETVRGISQGVEDVASAASTAAKQELFGRQ